MLHTYSIYETKTHLSSLLKRVKKGGEVVISDRGAPVAKIVPFSPEETFNERMKHLQSIGTILPRKRKSVPQGVKRRGGLGRFLRERE